MYTSRGLHVGQQGLVIIFSAESPNAYRNRIAATAEQRKFLRTLNECYHYIDAIDR